MALVASLVIDTDASLTAAADPASPPAGDAGDAPPDAPPPEEPPPGGSSTQAPPPEDSTEGPPTEPASEFDATIDELIAFVEEARGLAFQTRPEVAALPEDDFVDRYQTVLAEDLAEDPEGLAHFSGIYAALGLLPPGVDLAEALSSFGDAGVLGFYDPETDELVVRGEELTPYTRLTIVHELVHAIDDQWFDLDRPAYEDAVDEVGFGFSAVVEGNARRIEDEYRRSRSAAERAEIDAEEFSFGIGVDLSAFTPAFIDLQLAPYQFGEVFVDGLVARGGNEALAEALESPPVTSEQVVDVDAFDEGEGAIDVPPPPADGPVVEEGIFGQVLIEILLINDVGAGLGISAGEGWGGDWFVSWDQGDDTCLRVDMVGDTDRDTDELFDGFSRWVQGRAGASAERVDDRVRLTACT